MLTLTGFPLNFTSPPVSLWKTSTLTSFHAPFCLLLAIAWGSNCLRMFVYSLGEFRLSGSAFGASLLNLYCRCKLLGCILRIFVTWPWKSFQETVDKIGPRGVWAPWLGSLTLKGTSKVSVFLLHQNEREATDVSKSHLALQSHHLSPHQVLPLRPSP